MARWKEIAPDIPPGQGEIMYMACGSIVRKIEVFSQDAKRTGGRLWVKKRQQWQWPRWHYWPVFKTESEASQVSLGYFQDNNPEPDY